MSPSEWDHYILAAYDEVTFAAGLDGIKKVDADQEIAIQARDAIAAGNIELPDVFAAVQKTTRSIDDSRSKSLVDDITYALDALKGETILGPDDPVLKTARPLGHGLRKALTYCGLEDLDELVAARRQNMANIVASFERVAAGIDDLKREMRARGATIVADLFGPVP